MGKGPRRKSPSARGSVKRRHKTALGETFVAKNHGRCAACRGAWEPGDYISYGPEGYGHAVCPSAGPQPLYRVAPID